MLSDAKILSAIDAAEATCRANEIELRVPPAFVVDVLVNSTLHSETCRPEFLEWARGMIGNLPELGPDQRQTLLALTEV